VNDLVAGISDDATGIRSDAGQESVLAEGMRDEASHGVIPKGLGSFMMLRVLNLFGSLNCFAREPTG
jgi:hypothetical protein